MSTFFLQVQQISLIVFQLSFQRRSFSLLVGVQLEILLIQHLLNRLFVTLVKRIEFSPLFVFQRFQLRLNIGARMSEIAANFLLQRFVLTRLRVVRLFVLPFDVRLFQLNDGER